ncbi:Transcription initiation factor TFIID subunit 7 [Cyphellophora attinorum]|uniref:Transcription initiation factor TFIID subunit 7 n=1 Tax=Cyphellophora attinorum TaxID=1664694 RepID=A0A0N1HAI9_9EURO|nr:Transcription initiation factor TFIID subunit 7 [Phialophora attinorum]KPI45006.1 Transcription initiation factor TFIID subunit 7 [Phialophora attinorum]
MSPKKKRASGTRRPAAKLGGTRISETRAKLNAEAAKKANFISFDPALPTAPKDTSLPPPAPTGDPKEPPDMRTLGAWDKNLANANRQNAPSEVDISSDDVSFESKTSNKRKSALRRPSHLIDHEALDNSRAKRRRTNRKKSVAFVAPEDTYSEGPISPPPTDADERSDKENYSNDDDMEAPARPKLKLMFSGTQQPPSSPPTATPAATPTLRLSIGNKGKDGSAKKRKREDNDVGRSVSMDTPLTAGAGKIRFTNKRASIAQTPVTPAINLKAKGKVQKRKLGVGYDSELSESERDPVILEGMMLRMLPGPDCDYIRDAINKGTMGISKAQGGADISVRVLDDRGRRCVVRVRQTQYAASLVDLPCLIEGMKSWDGKRFIKSIDVCQMLLVLGKVSTDEEAKKYPLPEEVDPKTYAYAHGITAPMHWVRKRRFDRTKRKSTHHIEAVERRVNQLDQMDAEAFSTSYTILDYDPKERGEDGDQYSESQEAEEDEEEDEDEEEEEGYFEYDPHPEAAQRHVGDDEVDELEALMGGGDDEDDADISMAEASHGIANGHHVDSSGFATSDANSPDVTGSAAPTTAATPAGEVSTPAGPSEAEGGDDSDDGDAEDDDADHGEQNEQDEKNAATKERISTLQTKIDEQRKQLEKTTTNIIRKRIAQNIQKLETEISMLNRELNGGKDDDGEEDGDEDEEEGADGGGD